MKTAEIRKMNDEDIALEVASLKRRLYDLRCQQVTEKIQNTAQFGQVKKDIARLLTELNARGAAR
ncbi:MAG: 50S ribosomal protein L29 [Phycisphaerae bacterium]|nr:50S ribosomal protein L29 [Phycisphaerae bacterium]